MVCRDCLGRTPFASLIATIVCCVGVGLFCATLYRALEITLKGVFEGLFNFPVPWMETMGIVFMVVASGMGAFSILVLVFGFLATGATRENLYSGAKCIMGGRVSAAFFLGITYVLNFCWMCITSVCALPVIIYVMLNSICIVEIQDKDHWYYEGYCLNLSRFGIYRNFTEGVTKNALCEDHELSDFCQHVHDAGPMYLLAFVGSLLIVIALVHFLLSLGSNYHKIKVSKELTEYRDAVDLELSDSRVIANKSGAMSGMSSYGQN